MEETAYIALRPLLLPNAPGTVPSSVRVKQGEVFYLDGTEPLNVGLLLTGQSIRLWVPEDGYPKGVETEHDRRRVRRANRLQRKVGK